MMFASSTVKSFVALLVAFCAQTAAIPVAEKRQVSALSTAQITAFRPYTHYASTAYCSPDSTFAWNCGANCQANPQFKPIASGGDGTDIQFWFVGFDPNLEEVIVAHQGTDTSQIMPILEDADIIFETLDPTLFPRLSDDVKAHSGFAGSQSRSAPGVLAAVKSALAQHGTQKITVVGHSLGAAIGIIDTVFLHLQLPGTTTRFIGYGMPRVGNQEFADLVDSLPISVAHINNKEDIVPILPGRFLGYHHPSGEIHIQDSGAWLACPGQDNTDDRCTVGDVPNIFEGDPFDHSGPFDGITMGC